ncbi:hypothetical protein JAAARDRAFT_34909 [Jaapia argillacea MUCL 33604]|uniref:Uncharacterized protein n=1 Tax=Jaapia argillacea MUCL 33604 TaxID=933084 RepID=A0A067Q3P9_9AGAM|nr:hypothetical protein JAAARDRAFT_34909 [Jaapia argillacea MUCL 33604]
MASSIDRSVIDACFSERSVVCTYLVVFSMVGVPLALYLFYDDQGLVGHLQMPILVSPQRTRK